MGRGGRVHSVISPHARRVERNKQTLRSCLRAAVLRRSIERHRRVGFHRDGRLAFTADVAGTLCGKHRDWLVMALVATQPLTSDQCVRERGTAPKSKGSPRTEDRHKARNATLPGSSRTSAMETMS